MHKIALVGLAIGISLVTLAPTRATTNRYYEGPPSIYRRATTPGYGYTGPAAPYSDRERGCFVTSNATEEDTRHPSLGTGVLSIFQKTAESIRGVRDDMLRDFSEALRCLKCNIKFINNRLKINIYLLIISNNINSPSHTCSTAITPGIAFSALATSTETG